MSLQTIDIMDAARAPEPAWVTAGGAAPSLSLLPAADLTAADWDEWDRVAAATADANIFASAWVVRAGLSHCRGSAEPVAALLRGADGRMLGAGLFTLQSHLGRIPLRTLGDFQHPNAFLNCIAVARGWEETYFRALIEQVATNTTLSPTALCLGQIVQDSALHHGLSAACSALGLPLVTESRFERAMLHTNLSADAYWEAAVRSKKRKELRRQWARLGELGMLGTTMLCPHNDIGEWIDAFLALEQSGWKGRAGSALASAPGTRAYFIDVVAEAHRRGAVQAMMITLNAAPIAMLITLIDRDGGFSFKTAFDEDYARFSPGVLLQREALSSIIPSGLHWVDSCAAPDHPMIDSLWRERRTMLTLSLPLPGYRARCQFALVQAAKQCWHRIKQWRSGARAIDSNDKGQR